jgi:hypothetical protein
VPSPSARAAAPLAPLEIAFGLAGIVTPIPLGALDVSMDFAFAAARLALDDLPALLRRRRRLLGVRHVVTLMVITRKGSGSNIITPLHFEHGEDHDRDRRHRRLRYAMEFFIAW